MTTEQELKNLPLAATSPIKFARDKFKGVPPLRRRLLTWLLPATLLPLIIGTGIEYNISKNRAEAAAFAKLQGDSLLASEEVNLFLNESFRLHTVIENSPLLLEAMRSATQLAQAQGLPNQPIEAVEEKYASTKLLQVNPELNNYLQRIVKNTNLAAEIIVTEANGFNVAYSNLTSDFVQRDEEWWQVAQQGGRFIEESEFDRSIEKEVFPLSKAVYDPDTGKFLGVIKIGVLSTEWDKNLAVYLSENLGQTEVVQVVDVDETDEPLATITRQGANPEAQDIVGNEQILKVADVLSNAFLSGQTLEEVRQALEELGEIDIIALEEREKESQTYYSLEFEDEGKIFTITTIPNIDFVSIASIDFAEISAEERSLLLVFALTAGFLGLASVALIVLLARQITKPITNLSATTQAAAEGNLDVWAELGGSRETQILADNFNYLVTQTKASLEQQKDLVEAQRQEKEQLELAIYTLIDEVSDATDGDLTVRANLDSLELSTVADLFNAIIDNLQEIAIEAKQSSSQVGSSLQQNEVAIQKLAEQATNEAKETRDILKSVAKMSQSIQTVAVNADRAEKIADDTYNTVLNSTSNMDSTVNSILSLRTTVSDTAQKMQRLAESSQKISQAVSLIEEITLKTNVLAINAGAEADRAGEYGRGFSVVAEQVGMLAEQSKAAIKEIASIVSGIQAETQEVKQAMESGTTQVINTTHVVENTKQSLAEVLEKSQTIDQLMKSISQSTESQADTSQNVTSLMQKIARLSAITSKSSTEVARSIGKTARVAQKLESTVSQFKVAE